MSADSLNSGRRRRTYTRQFKAEMVAQCMQGNVSLASLAVEHGMNANVLHRWVTEHERYGHHILSDDDRREQDTTTLMVPTPQSDTPFLPVLQSASQSPVSNETIRLELKRGVRILAGERRSAVRRTYARVVALIRIDQIWLAVDPVDMRSGMDRLLARVVEVFGTSQPHHAYVFANRRGTRLKVLVCDGFGIWLAVRRLHQGSVQWPRPGETQIELSAEQACALVIGLPWQRLGEHESIAIL